MEKQASFLRRRWVRWTGGGFLAAVGVTAIVVSVLLHRAEPFLRARIVAALEQHFHARVELDSFHMSLLDGLRAEGKGLRIWPPDGMQSATIPGAARAETPLIQLAEFRFHAPLRYRPGAPIHISVIELKGLEIDLPPRARFHPPAIPASFTPSSMSAPTPVVLPGAGFVQFQVDSVECADARLTLETDKPGKLPLMFTIAQLKLAGPGPGRSLGLGGAMDFAAELTNPRPVGIIHTTGRFGPWVVRDPGESALAGQYRFEHADLSGFRGIAGMLRSTGRYQGTLRDMVVDGETDTPDFRLTHFGNPMPLHTQFHALVDATNGDTRLEPVEATLGQSHFTARGQIVRQMPDAGQPGGHSITLAVNVDHGRMEDFLRLASRSQTPLLTGVLNMQADLAIPPGPVPVVERLKLNGKFLLDQAQFTSPKIQDRIEELSLRGQGRPGDLKNPAAADVRSTMQGDFQMAGGVVTMPHLVYTVPGAEIDLKGSYIVDGGRMNFAGRAKMRATVSQMVGGWKGLLLKPLDRYFSKDDAGTAVSIHVRGTRDDPDIGVDLKHLNTTHPQSPAQTR